MAMKATDFLVQEALSADKAIPKRFPTWSQCGDDDYKSSDLAIDCLDKVHLLASNSSPSLLG